MALSAKQRQKKLEQKKKKRKLQKTGMAEVTPSKNSASRYANCPIHECLVPKGFSELGLVNVMVSRRMADGRIAAGVLLVDVHCLGVKDAMFKVVSPNEYEHTLKQKLMLAHAGEDYQHVEPSCAKKLVEGAVAYAAELGFAPHRDYRAVASIFGAVDADACTDEYTYGKDGKPFYVRGINESPSRARKIYEQLEQKCGEGNFGYLIG